MSRKLVIFGTGEIAQLAHYYYDKESDYKVIAFTVDSSYLNSSTFCGLPVVDFRSMPSIYPPGSYDLFIALSYSKLNAIRKEKYTIAKSLGYKLASFISPRATILNDANIGDNCFILENNTIQPYVVIGDNVTLWSGNHIGHHSIVKSHSFISSHVVVSGGVEIGEQCFVGVNATFRDHVSIGNKSIIGAGALILSDVEPEGLYVGQESKRSKVPSTRLKKI